MTQQEAEVKLKVNSKEALDKINKLEQEAEQLRQKFNDCFRKGDTSGLTKNTEELNKVNKELKNLRTNAANIEAAMKRIDKASPKELNRTLRMINAELNSGRVPRGSKEWYEYCEQVKRVKRELSLVKNEMQEQEGVLGELKGKLSDWGTAAAGAVGAFAGLAMSGKAAVEAYADMEAEEANVRKFTGMTADEVKQLNDEFKKIDTRTSREELNKLAQEAGRLGKQSVEDVLGFVKAADQINVALDDLGEGATLTLSKLTGIFGDEERLGTERSLLAVGSVINELSQNCSASAPYLAEFTSRLGGAGAQAKMTIPQIMAFAAVLDTQNINVEASSTALSQLLMKLYQEPAKFAKAAGLDVKEFTNLLTKDANEALIVLLESLNKLGGLDKLSPVLDEMGTDGANASKVMAALAGHIEEVRLQQINANLAFEDATSVSQEFAVQNNTVQAALDKEKKKFSELTIELGQKLLPVMRFAVSGSSALMQVFNILADFVIKFKGSLLALVVTIAAYNIAVKSSAILTGLWSAAMKVNTAVAAVWKATLLLCNGAVSLLRGNVTRASASMRLFSKVLNIKHPAALAVAAIVGVGAALHAMVYKFNEDARAAAKARRELEEFKKGLTDIEETAQKNAIAEKSRLEMLYEAATNENKSREERIKAVKELQKLYPDYFTNMQAEAIMAGNAKEKYDELTESIILTAQARAAADKIQQNESKIIDLKMELREKQQKKAAAEQRKDDANKRIADANQKKNESASTWLGGFVAAGQTEGNGSFTTSGDAYQTYANEARNATQEIKTLNKEIKTTNDQLDALAEANEYLKTEYGGLIINAGTEQNPSVNIPTAPKGETEKERKAREKREREAKKAAREAEKNQKEALKEDLDKQKAQRDRDEAKNLSEYSSGAATYAEYIKRKNEIDEEYVKNRKQVYEKANLAESDEYAALLKEEEELKAQSLERVKKASLRDVESEHKDKLNKLSMQYFDPKSTMFRNQKAYNQALLDEDLRYLNKKLELYSDGSEEWAQINDQINERLKQDQLEKQKETAEALMQYSEYYQQLDREARLAHEEDLLKQLHDLGIFSEEEYQKALQSIRRKYQSEETQAQKAEIDKRHKEIEDEFQDAKDILAYSTDIFGKTLLDMMLSWQEMMSDMANNGEGFWTSFAKLAHSTLSLVSAMMSQFTAYSNAQRDLELANIENRYDKEIKAAGKNSKKVEQLEEQKEKEIAETKKKYNDQAMKMEIAQAIAQTAVNAILGYQAGLKFPFPANTFMPAVLAGLAVAQGAIQIATIKKQHEAQAAGYYEGGFTGGNKYKKEAGVVHEGEFVANHNAVNNPHLSGLFRLLDYAQRNNTVGSLTAEDVSNALGQGQGVSARGEVAGATPTIVTNSIDTSSLDTLNALLAEGIEAVVILDGERGLHRKYTHFQKLINNPKR